MKRSGQGPSKRVYFHWTYGTKKRRVKDRGRYEETATSLNPDQRRLCQGEAEALLAAKTTHARYESSVRH